MRGGGGRLGLGLGVRGGEEQLARERGGRREVEVLDWERGTRCVGGGVEAVVRVRKKPLLATARWRKFVSA